MRLGVLSQPHHPALHDILDRLRKSAEKIGAELVLTADLLAEAGGDGPPLEDEVDELDFLLTLGGDGTLLRGARFAGPSTGREGVPGWTGWAEVRPPLGVWRVLDRGRAHGRAG